MILFFGYICNHVGVFDDRVLTYIRMPYSKYFPYALFHHDRDTESRNPPQVLFSSVIIFLMVAYLS